jgi:hypothetical protein
VELRVHGVSGQPAEDMLDRQVIGRVAGDGDAGFYRPRIEYGEESTVGPGGARLEAYRWGSLTSGAASRAFWLILLPLTLANLAMWLRPPSKGFGRYVVRVLCRIFALSMTATYVLANIGVGVDLLGWQCARPDTTCVNNRTWLTWPFTGYFEPPGRRMALAALVPIFAFGGLWFLARRSWSAYEKFSVPDVNKDGDGLAAPTFWDGRAQVIRLRLLHVASAFAVLDAMLLYVLIRHDRDAGAFAGVDLGFLTADSARLVGEGIAALVALVLVCCPLLLCVSRMVDRDSKVRWPHVVAGVLAALSLLLTVATLAYAMLPRAPWATVGPLPGYSATVTWLFTVQIGLIALLVLAVLTQRHRAKGALLGGFGTPVVASLALGMGGAFAASVSYRVADYLGGSVKDTTATANGHRLGLQPPVSYQWAAFGFLFAFAVGILGLLWVAFVTSKRLRHKAGADTDRDFPGGRDKDRARAEYIDDKIANARLTDRLGSVIGVLWFVVGAGGVAATALGVAGKGPVDLAPAGSKAAGVLHDITYYGTGAVGLFIIGLIILGIQTYRSPRLRRTVGIIWDVATFWPRASHPLAPPCYAERVVPELVKRSTYLAEQNGVILSGHSQGAVLVAATVLQLPPRVRQRTALLTYGAPIRRLYARGFPAYVNDDVITEVGRAVADPNGDPRWRNLWRFTDPIGGAVGIGDIRFTDPPGFLAAPGDTVDPAVQGHSGYQTSEGFGDVVAGLADRLPR